MDLETILIAAVSIIGGAYVLKSIPGMLSAYDETGGHQIIGARPAIRRTFDYEKANRAREAARKSDIRTAIMNDPCDEAYTPEEEKENQLIFGATIEHGTAYRAILDKYNEAIEKQKKNSDYTILEPATYKRRLTLNWGSSNETEFDDACDILVILQLKTWLDELNENKGPDNQQLREEVERRLENAKVGSLHLDGGNPQDHLTAIRKCYGDESYQMIERVIPMIGNLVQSNPNSLWTRALNTYFNKNYVNLAEREANSSISLLNAYAGTSYPLMGVSSRTPSNVVQKGNSQ